MRLLTGSKWSLLFFVTALSNAVCAQSITEENPLEYVAIEAGNALINKQTENQTKNMRTVALYQTTINGQFTAIKGWEAKYNAYLKTTKGFAESLKSGASLYAEGVKTLTNIYSLTKAVSYNPQGIAASIVMSDIYIETALEFAKTYNTLKNSIVKGSEENMLNGASRARILWQLRDRLAELNNKLHTLSLSIAYYNMMDVWNHATAGLSVKSHKDTANEALDRWKRAYEAANAIR